jgi:hypothetical protein
MPTSRSFRNREPSEILSVRLEYRRPHTWRQDPLKLLARECRRQDLKLFFYYSQLDWHNPNYYPLGRTGPAAGQPAGGDWYKYLTIESNFRFYCLTDPSALTMDRPLLTRSNLPLTSQSSPPLGPAAGLRPGVAAWVERVAVGIYA